MKRTALILGILLAATAAVQIKRTHSWAQRAAAASDRILNLLDQTPSSQREALLLARAKQARITHADSILRSAPIWADTEPLARLRSDLASDIKHYLDAHPGADLNSPEPP